MNQVTNQEFCIRIPALPNVSVIEDRLREALHHRVLGRVAAVTGESIELEGITAPLGAICEVRSSNGSCTKSRVIGFRGSRPILAPLEVMDSFAAGDSVKLVQNSLQLRVGDALCGRVIDAFGRPLDGLAMPGNLTNVKAEQNPPTSMERPPINQPFQTGVQAIDGLLTCGQGQRIGIFAGSGIGKSTLLGMLAKGCHADRIVIGLVGERGREVKEFVDNILGEEGLSRSVVVAATSDTPAAQRVSAAWTATAIAESFRDQGQHVLLLLDSVTRFAMAQREIGLAAGEPPTTRGYPPSVFHELPRLVERAGRTSLGTITAFYTVLVEGDDQNEPIADSLRGLLDGHFVLDRALAEAAQYPPIDILSSLSRLQPNLVDQHVSDAVSKARQYLADYRRTEDLISIGAYRKGNDEKIDTAIAIRDSMRDYLKQDFRQICSLDDAQQSLVELINQAPRLLQDNQMADMSRLDPVGTSVNL